MLSKPIETTKREWATHDRIPHMLGAAVLALIVVSGSISAYAQQPRNAPPADRASRYSTPSARVGKYNSLSSP